MRPKNNNKNEYENIPTEYRYIILGISISIAFAIMALVLAI